MSSANGLSERTTMLALRVWILVLLLMAIIVMGTASVTYYSITFSFTEIKAFSYVISVAVIGFVYTLVQTGLILLATTQQQQPILPPFLVFAGDLVVSYLLVSAGSSGVTIVIDSKVDTDSVVMKMVRHASGAISMEFLAFALLIICTVLSARKAFGHESELQAHANNSPAQPRHGVPPPQTNQSQFSV